eukprot:2038507-Rhodomonas_salina.2
MSDIDITNGAVGLCTCYLMSGTDLVSATVRLYACYAMFGTDVAYQCYAMSGTNEAYGADRHYGKFRVVNLCEDHEEKGNGNYDVKLLYGQVHCELKYKKPYSSYNLY